MNIIFSDSLLQLYRDMQRYRVVGLKVARPGFGTRQT
jgi:hypothetical protein